MEELNFHDKERLKEQKTGSNSFSTACILSEK